MINLALILLLFIFPTCARAAITNPICQGKRYLCSLFNETDYCVHINDPLLKVHYVNACPDGYYCDYQRAYDSLDNMTFKCQPKVAVQQAPEEPCNKDSQCISNSCNGGYCQGNALNNGCLVDTNCSTGLFCNTTTKVCEKQKKYLSTCDSDSSCINSCVCNLGVCNYYYSLTEGTLSNNAKACRKGYLENGVCSVPPRSSYQLSLCSSDSDCTVVTQNGSVVTGLSKCQCGFNGGGYSYCSLVEGDSVYQQMITQFAYVLMSNEDCHTSVRQGPCHNLFHEQYIEYAKLKLQFMNGPKLVYNDKCTKSTINYWYWSLASLRLCMFITLFSYFIMI